MYAFTITWHSSVNVVGCPAVSVYGICHQRDVCQLVAHSAPGSTAPVRVNVGHKQERTALNWHKIWKRRNQCCFEMDWALGELWNICDYFEEINCVITPLHCIYLHFIIPQQLTLNEDKNMPDPYGLKLMLADDLGAFQKHIWALKSTSSQNFNVV